MFRCILWWKTFFFIIKVYRILKYAAVAHFLPLFWKNIAAQKKKYAETSHYTHCRLTLETSDANYYSDKYQDTFSCSQWQADTQISQNLRPKIIA